MSEETDVVGRLREAEASLSTIEALEPEAHIARDLAGIQVTLSDAIALLEAQAERAEYSAACVAYVDATITLQDTELPRARDTEEQRKALHRSAHRAKDRAFALGRSLRTETGGE